MNAADNIIRELPKGLINWYDFEVNSRVLHVVKEEDVVTEFLKQKGLQVECISPTELLSDVEQDKTLYDYVILINQLEECNNPKRLLSVCKKYIKTEGTMLLGVDNRLGLRYFCGDRDPFTNRSFDGVENYRRTDVVGGRCYSKAEVEEFLGVAGFADRKFYSIMPQLQCPQLIFAENYLPKEDLAIRYFPIYHYPDSVFLEEQHLYTSLAQNGMFHAMANSYLIECTLPERFANVCQVTVTMDRGKEDALLTIIREDNTVEKQAIYEEGKLRLEQLLRNGEQLRKMGLSVVNAKIENGRYIMPYIDGEIAAVYLRSLLCEDKEKFITEMDRFRELILKSSVVLEETEDGGAILEKAYFDMVPINCFYANGEFVFFDQEFTCDNYPANVMILRMIEFVYNADKHLEEYLSKKFFFKRYGLQTRLEEWYMMSNCFLAELRNEKPLRVYHERHHGNLETIHTNRQRMNYPEAEYQRLFVDIFKSLENKKLVLFGSGRFAKKFIALYADKYPAHMIVDNSEGKWGTTVEGVPVCSPESLKEMDKDEYKVIICIKDYPSVLQQLQDAGVKHIGIYDSNKDYEVRDEIKVVAKAEDSLESKKYHIGYMAGVYDLFHIGHLNLFKRAKEQCDHLIVGVVSDEGARKHKRVEPFVPFEERIEMVRSCKYVDEAVEIPLNYGGTRDAYRLYHFDAQFSGSDYVDNPDWLAEKEFLEKHGAELVFFPYTESTSSSKLKKLIDSKLL